MTAFHPAAPSSSRPRSSDAWRSRAAHVGVPFSLSGGLSINVLGVSVTGRSAVSGSATLAIFGVLDGLPVGPAVASGVANLRGPGLMLAPLTGTINLPAGQYVSAVSLTWAGSPPMLGSLAADTLDGATAFGAVDVFAPPFGLVLPAPIDLTTANFTGSEAWLPSQSAAPLLWMGA